jgi:hypothetical protein
MNITLTQLGAGIGTLLGIINALVLFRDRQQRVTIDQVKGNTPLDSRITNRTHRPIPIESVVLRFQKQLPDLTWRDVDYKPETGNFKIPGSLAPETSVPFHWSIHDIVAFVLYKKVQIVVNTQTGKQITKKFRHAKASHRITGSHADAVSCVR